MANSLIGPTLLSDIRQTIDVVRGNGGRQGVYEIPTRFQSHGGGGGFVRLGKTTAAWSKGSLATIDLYERGSPGNEARNDSPYTLENCVNKFADVGSGKWVMVAKMTSGQYYLIAAECD